MRKYFGTDGVRGTANKTPMTPDVMMKLAAAAGSYFKMSHPHHRSKVIIGKDTRLSGYLLEPALTSGFISVGMDVKLLGPLPTPAISMLVRSLRADLGVMISASHNPYEDNGVKLFGPDGYKLSDDIERIIEEGINAPYNLPQAAPHELGRAQRLDDAPGRYIEFVKNTFPKMKNLEGLKIVIDSAHGAAYKVAPLVFWELGAEIIAIGDHPDGLNINKDCGATKPQAMCEAVVRHKAHLGISLDGDADRIIMADEKGQIIDGDQLMALITASWHNDGLLKGQSVIGTVMSNLGLEHFVQRLGLNFVRAPVGDRYVSEYMKAHDANLGGEQSGHIILSDYARTGDGLVAGLQVLSVYVSQSKPMSELARAFNPVPQILRNLRVKEGLSLDSDIIQGAIEQAKNYIGETGNLLVRKSGTEPLLRLMAQGTDPSKIDLALNSLSEVLEKEGCLDHHP